MQRHCLDTRRSTRSWLGVGLLALAIPFGCSSSGAGGSNSDDTNGGSGGVAGNTGGGGTNGGSSGSGGLGGAAGSSSHGGASGSGSGGAGGNAGAAAGSGGHASGGSAGGGTAGAGVGGSGGAQAGGAGGVHAGGTGGAVGGAAGGGASGSGGGAGAGMGGVAGGTVAGNPKFGNAVFLAVAGDHSALSADGKDWTVYTDGVTPSGLEVIGACFGADTALIVNHNGAFQQGIWASTNGHNFAKVWPAGTGSGLPGEDCAFSNGVFSAGNQYSTDAGKTWMDTTNDNGVGNRGLAFGNGVFVGAGDADLSWSADGKVWTKATPSTGTFNGLSHVVFGGGKFVATPYDNANTTWESTDGKTWKPAKQSLKAGNNSNGLGAGVHKIFNIESDGVYWMPDDTAPGTSDWTKIATDLGGNGVAGTSAIVTNGKYWSSDGVTWTASGKPDSKDIVRILVVGR